jgi:hypothetical protein
MTRSFPEQKSQTQEDRTRQPSARCHWNRENIPLTRFDFPNFFSVVEVGQLNGVTHFVSSACS